MCCILCEEPVRSVTLGLAAVGIVAVVNGVRTVLQKRAVREQSTQCAASAAEVAAAEPIP